jgi:UDP-N-acetylglucosamine--N-acetylmuramyl-(pentapeptide) pyrophosphoryl-undecaprenol N-acetylglucosamine transferase
MTSTSTIRIVICGGGTSGHVLPAVAIAEMLEDEGVHPEHIHFIGTQRGIDENILSQTQYPFTLLNVIGAKHQLSPRAVVHNVRMLLLLRKATRISRKLMKEMLPNVVVSVGGYGSLAPMQAAKKLGIQRVVVSYDSQPGLATKRQARDAHLVTKSHPHSPLSTATLVGAPIRRHLRQAGQTEIDNPTKNAARAVLGIPLHQFVVVVMGGSLGSALLNNVTEQLRLDEKLNSVFWYHIAGNRYVENGAPMTSPNCIQVGYEARIQEVYQAADLVISRSGASTIGEISTLGVASILIPWAGAADNHQEQNARLLSDVGGALLITEEHFTAQKAEEAISDLVQHSEKLTDLRKNAYFAGELNRRAELGSLIATVARATE